MSRGNEKILQATLELNLSKRILVRLSVVLSITFRFLSEIFNKACWPIYKCTDANVIITCITIGRCE